jgi:predicted ATPase
VTGDAVNVAARLQQNASSGEIVAGERTANAAKDSFLFEDTRLVEVKGKKQPLHVFPLKGPQTVRKVNHPPFVGRKQDLMQLQLLQARILEEQRPQLVSIVAPAGTGKTRLLEEFLNRLDPADGFQAALVRCLPYGQTLTYWPLRGLLDGLLQGEEITKSQVMSVFMQGGYKHEDATYLTNLVLSTLGIEGEGTGTTDRESIYTAWRLLIEVFAQKAPRILVFEDLHWASDSMLDLVEHVINLLTHARLLLVILSRPELLDRRPTWGGGRQNFTTLALQPLTTAQTQDLITTLKAGLLDITRK